MQVLIVDPPDSALPVGTVETLCDRGWDVTRKDNYAGAMEVACSGSVGAVIMTGPDAARDGCGKDSEFADLLRIFEARRIATIVVDDHPESVRSNNNSLVEIVAGDVSAEELRGRVAMIERYHEHLTRLERELHNMERLGKRLNEHFREVDQEMRLAGRLQRDFLPQIREPVGNAQFAAVFRPASWVSGDIFDVFRIDEEWTGFYVADAVGHGMAASLLTMFIKRSMQPKKVHSEGYEVLSPSETIGNLNTALAEQSLPNCQFVTACYGVINHRTLVFRYARGGHPYPILITSDGITVDLKTQGGLLGLFKGEEFPTLETQLHVGDKVLFYSDGVELAFPDSEDGRLNSSAFRRTIESLARLSMRGITAQLEAQLDEETGSLNPRDDVTIVGLEILSE